MEYINAIPLAAAPGFGEVLGLGDGLWAWYGMDFKTATELLLEASGKDLSPESIDEAGVAVKAALSLLLAQRRPSVYLISHRKDLEELTNAYCRILAKKGVFSPAIGDAAIKSRLNFQEKGTLLYPMELSSKKAVNFIRSNLLTSLGIQRFYDLDRLDLEVKSVIDADLQKTITQALYRLKDPLFIEQEGLIGKHLLDKGDPSKVIYSFSLYETTPAGNMLRVQTNNYDGAFNIDEQMKLDMGSSAKLRVLVHYLDILTKLHEQHLHTPHEALKRLVADVSADPLTRWAADYFSTGRNRDLSALLEAGMNRMYSANPGERFFTGGGLHTFTNFNPEDNVRVMSVREAFRRIRQPLSSSG